MGLLDEAIRDHLELKRRRGADPSDIARAEREALEPIFPPEDGASDGDPVAGLGPEPMSDDGYLPEPDGHATLHQDTAEIDMRAVLEEADAEPQAPQPPDPVSAAEEDLLEWETRARAGHEDPARAEAVLDGVDEQIPGQERISFE
jgi:hypothetical protein